MAKIKLTKGELKRQRDGLRQYKRYLPTLQLKKQQLQLEILRFEGRLAEIAAQEEARLHAIYPWAGLLTDAQVSLARWLRPELIVTDVRNIAGVDIPVFERVEFLDPEYDYFVTPLWVDAGIEQLRQHICLKEEIKVLEKALGLLRRELRVTTQRVNLFEKIKIPEAEDAIRVIKIYIGDQMANAVGRSKIAKRKIEFAAVAG